MSAATRDTLSAAVEAHVADETGGDIVVGWALVAGIVEHGVDSKTAWLSTSRTARYEARGLLGEGLVLLDTKTGE